MKLFTKFSVDLETTIWKFQAFCCCCFLAVSVKVLFYHSSSLAFVVLSHVRTIVIYLGGIFVVFLMESNIKQ